MFLLTSIPENKRYRRWRENRLIQHVNQIHPNSPAWTDSAFRMVCSAMAQSIVKTARMKFIYAVSYRGGGSHWSSKMDLYRIIFI